MTRVLSHLAQAHECKRHEASHKASCGAFQIPPGRARNYRDDISVIVIHFNEKFLEDVEPSTAAPESIEAQAK